jgi:CRP-like cAMP-binding protein
MIQSRRTIEASAFGINCFTCQMRERTEWCQLAGNDLRALNQAKVCNVYESGQIVFYQGNPCLGIFCVESGTVAVRKADNHGNSALVRLIHAGQTLGYRSYFGGSNYTAGAEALTRCQVCFIDREAVKKLLAGNPSVGLLFLKHSADDLEASEEARLHSATLTVRARVAHLLLALKDRFATVDDEGTLTIELPMSRRDMADIVGTRPETIARTIRSLETDDVAIFKGRRVTVRDLDALLDELETPEQV